MAAIQTRLSFPVKKRSSILRSSKIKSDSKGVCNVEGVTIISDDKADVLQQDVIKKTVTPRKTNNRLSNIDNNNVTPPKQRRLNHNIDSYEDIENKDINGLSPKTPSTLFGKLKLDSGDRDSSSRKKLFGNCDKYKNASHALHSTVPNQMPARSEELEKLFNFINNHLQNATSGTLYISGPPGTGKTAALTKTLTDLQVDVRYKDVYINCTSIKSATSVYSKIATELGIKTTAKSEKGYLSAIDKYFSAKHKPIILVLDEIDQLDSRKQSVLYTIFEWPSKPTSHLILIGIANALDLTDRILPRLQSRCELKPHLMHFAPYTKQQIIEILTNRLNEAAVSDVFNPVAVQMLAGKVSAVSGDVRRALDIARRVIELVVTEQNQKRILQPFEELNAKIDQLVGVDKVVTVLNNVYGTCQNLEDDVDESVPLQQKLVLCSLVLILKKGKNRDVTVGKLHDVYRKVCAKRNLSTIDMSEFVGLCSLLETRGMIKVHGRKEPRLNKVCLEWDEDEVSAILKDKQLMASVLDDETILVR